MIGADGTIYAGGYAWNPDGTLKWKLAGISPCIPAIGQDGTMYFGASNKYLYALPGVVTFTADQTAGLTPLAVRFTGTSDLNVTSWHWDFGDGTTSTEQNPTHTYTVGGVYSVNLTIAHGNGTNTLVKTDYISAYSPLAAGFTADPTSGTQPALGHVRGPVHRGTHRVALEFRRRHQLDRAEPDPTPTPRPGPTQQPTRST